jgi:hypothetical protein
MAYDTLEIQEVGFCSDPVFEDIEFTDIVADNDLQFDNTSGDVILLVKNAGSGAQTATIVPVADPKYGRTGTAPTIVCAAGETSIAGFFRPELYNQSDGMVYITSTTEDNFGFAAVRIIAGRR